MGISILHLTDIHFADDRNTMIMSAISNEFLRDLEYLLSKTANPIQLILFTGDLAFGGSYGEYILAETFFKELASTFIRSGADVPPLFAVPGNHDCDRSTIPNIVSLSVQRLWDEVANDFWSIDKDGLRAQVRESFASYAAWWQSPGIPVVGRHHEGIMPGDHSATLDVGGLRYGLLGINTAVRHLSSDVGPGDISISAQQVAAAIGGDISDWIRAHDICLLVTHHPWSWFDESSKQLLGELLFVRDGLFRFHISGHLHVPEASVGDRLAASEYDRLQGRSLFGLEQLRTGVNRSHGYQVLEIDDEPRRFRLWPRAAVRTAGGAWSISPDQTLGLPRGEESTAWKDLPGTDRPRLSPQSERGPEAAPDRVRATGSERAATIERLRVAIASGSVCLVLGDDLSGSMPANGEPAELARSRPVVAGTRAFRKELSDLAYESTIAPTGIERLSDLYKLASRKHSREVRALITAAAADISGPWRALRNHVIYGPWKQVTDLWISNDETPPESPVKIGSGRSFLCAAEDFNLDDRPIILKMNGTSNRPSSVTFQSPGVEPLTSTRRLWFQRLSIDFVRNPVLYVASSVTEIGLWEYIEIRGSDAHSRASVPMAYLVCPELTPIQEATLSLYKVLWIKEDVAEFCQSELLPSNEHIAVGNRELERRVSSSNSDRGAVYTVRDLRESAGGKPDVLLGREPSWGDVVGGFTTRFDHVTQMATTVKQGSSGIVLVHGTAGSGKSASLMYLALQLDAEGSTVVWLDRSIDLPIGELVDRITSIGPDYVVVDNVDVFGVFGARASDILERVSKATRVVAAVRTHQLERFESLTSSERFQMPDLTNGDIWALLAALERHGLLGDLRGKAASERFQMLAGDSRRQLLVALIQATKGRRFRDIISSEYVQLNSLQQAAYMLASLSSGLNEEGITNLELEMAAGGYGADARQATDSLLKAGILIVQPSGLISPRHRVIGEEVISLLAGRGELADGLISLLGVVAVSAKNTKDNSRRDRRLMIRLINHDQLNKFGLSSEEVRSVYSSVQMDLYEDFHFWLQRGSYELERGSLELALNYLKQARLAEGGHDDPYVLTEFSLARLRLAADPSTDLATAVGLGEQAIQDLGRVIRRQGVRSPHSVVALATAGLSWLETSTVTDEARQRYAKEVAELLGLAKDVASESDYAARTLADAARRLKVLLE